MSDGMQNGSHVARSELHPLDLLAVLVREWRTVLGALAAALLLSLLLLLFLPRSYSARTVLVLSKDQSQSPVSLAASQIGVALTGALGNANTNKQLVSAILKSRALQDSIATRIVPEADTVARDRVRATIVKSTEVKEEGDGSISVVVKSREAEAAARIANAFPTAVNAIVVAIGSHDARERRTFLEQQLATARERLEASQARLIEFAQSEDAPEIQEQARRTVETAATLQQAIIQSEIRVAQLRRTATASNPELQAAEAELSAQRAQLRRLTSGERNDSRLLLSLRESPKLKAANLRLMREFTKDEQVYLALTAALAETGIDVNNNLPVVSVLDVARIPPHPSSPDPRLVLGLAIALGLALGVAAAFIRDYAGAVRRDPEAEPFFEAWDQVKRDAAVYLRRRPGTPSVQ
jgi:uncharacterized protein involved in exopolysaccharide biosynthesis